MCAGLVRRAPMLPLDDGAGNRVGERAIRLLSVPGVGARLVRANAGHQAGHVTLVFGNPGLGYHIEQSGDGRELIACACVLPLLPKINSRVIRRSEALWNEKK
jgi:hypothetical protein